MVDVRTRIAEMCSQRRASIAEARRSGQFVLLWVRAFDLALLKALTPVLVDYFEYLQQKKQKASTRTAQRRKVHLAPGSRLLRVAEFIFTKREYEEFMSQPILDMQEEYIAALAERRHWKARWVRLRGSYAFFKAAGAYSVLRALWKYVRT